MKQNCSRDFFLHKMLTLFLPPCVHRCCHDHFYVTPVAVSLCQHTLGCTLLLRLHPLRLGKKQKEKKSEEHVLEHIFS